MEIIKSFGSVKGKVDCNGLAYFVRPLIGGVVQCSIHEGLLADVIAAVGMNATVSGILSCRNGEFTPYEIEIQKIEVYPADTELATLSSLAGTAPNATGGQSSVEFVKEFRSRWDNPNKPGMHDR